MTRSPRMKCHTVNLTQHQFAQLTALASHHTRSVSDLIREGVNLLILDLGGEVEQGTEVARDGLLDRIAEIEKRIKNLERHTDGTTPQKRL